jgi:hypothetical protein
VLRPEVHNPNKLDRIVGKVAIVALLGLPPQATDTLEVAAIHLSRADNLNTRIDPQAGGRLVIMNATLRTLIRNAYGALPFQLVGEPKWSESDRFDIDAKDASGQQITEDTIKPLILGLLAIASNSRPVGKFAKQPSTHS